MSEALLEFLELRADAVAVRVTQSLAQSGTAYSRMPVEALRRAIESVVRDGVLAAVRAGGRHFQDVLSNLARQRQAQGFTLLDLETALYFLRRELLETVKRERGESPEAVAEIILIGEVIDCGRLGAVEAYERLHEEQRERLVHEIEQRTRELSASHERLMQSEKLSAVGELVSGIAHELNNPLTGVLGFSQLLLGANVGEEISRQIRLIHEQGLRCQKIVQGLLTFSRRQKPERKRVGLNGIVEGTLELQAYTLHTRNVEVVQDLEPDLPMVFGDFHQLQQVVLNLVINACQAITASRGRGTLTVSTRHEHERVMLCVEDDGPGIAPEHLSRIFDPFFTTKPPGEGTGLGLSICYGIVQEHGGSIRADSQLGWGARFIVEFPVYEGEEVDAAAQREQAAVPNDASGLRILVVDDESVVLDLLYVALTSWGYRVDTAVNGEVGLRKILGGSYDLILCDHRMPGLSGREVYQRVRESDPEKARQFVFITGSLLSLRSQEFIRESKLDCLQKPLDLKALRDFLGRRLNAGAARSCESPHRPAY